ncbi:MAG: GGDEF domain-containing protein [Deltaproteobacteria bacterium]|nr:GGDEF domain-containing protein [Deltaproteobacteria bacterium]
MRKGSGIYAKAIAKFHEIPGDFFSGRGGIPADVRSYVEELEATCQALRQEVDRLSIFRHLAFRDDLTGLYNRRAFEARLVEEWSRAARFEADLTFVTIDLDGFKLVNDLAGHATGDLVLAFVARHMVAECRGFDVPCRLGGDEFAYLLPETNAAGAEALVRRVAERVATASDRPVLPEGVAFGLSFGVAERRGSSSPSDLVARADAAMYALKRERKSEGAPSSRVFAA